jgi:predicted amidophosphoribosyltransferase
MIMTAHDTNGRPTEGWHRLTDACEGCNTVHTDGDRFCSRCGKPVRRFCGACGAEIAQTIAFYCTQCGDRLIEPTTARSLRS